MSPDPPKAPFCQQNLGSLAITCALVVLVSLGFGVAHAESLILVGEIQTPDGLEHSVYANYASRSAFASVTAPSNSTEQVRFAAFGQDLTLARDYTNTEDGLLAWHGTDGSGTVAILIVEGTDVLGTIESADGSYAIVPASGGFHEVLELDEGLFPEWRGKQIAYRVFEWVGNQKLYSDEISFVLR